MIPKLLNFVWIGDTLPTIHGKSIDLFRHHNPEFAIMIWNETNIDRDLNVNLNELQRLFPEHAGVSNAVRLAALYKHGGLYFDLDFICHRPLDSLLKHHAVAAFQDDTRICNAFMGAEPKHPWIQWQLDHMNEWEGNTPEWGVYNATNAPRDGLTIVPTETIYPYHYDGPKEDRKITPATLAEHTWEGSWVP